MRGELKRPQRYTGLQPYLLHTTRRRRYTIRQIVIMDKGKVVQVAHQLSFTEDHHSFVADFRTSNIITGKVFRDLEGLSA